MLEGRLSWKAYLYMSLKRDEVERLTLTWACSTLKLGLLLHACEGDEAERFKFTWAWRKIKLKCLSWHVREARWSWKAYPYMFWEFQQYPKLGIPALDLQVILYINLESILQNILLCISNNAEWFLCIIFKVILAFCFFALFWKMLLTGSYQVPVLTINDMIRMIYSNLILLTSITVKKQRTIKKKSYYKIP